MRTPRILLALAAFLLALQWSKPALADITITGTVAEIGTISRVIACGVGNNWIIRFKLTDANQTTTCADQTNGTGALTKYAYIVSNGNGCGGTDFYWKEWFTMLLYSKKGAPITCTVVDNTNCHVTNCTLQ